ncbi:hypothetical protein KKJ00_07185 [Xenorhabdus bovienii]|nr:hypothetical protein [Xenorhabdus bovienii]
MFHNPNARFPLSPLVFGGAAQTYFLPDGNIRTTVPDFHPIGSITSVKVID